VAALSSPEAMLGAHSVAAESSTTSVRRVVLADVDVLLREGLATLLDRVGFSVVGQAGDASELLSLVRAFLPASSSWTSGCHPTIRRRAWMRHG
jgi:hypothetical protein